MVGVDPAAVGRFYGLSLITRVLEHGEIWALTDESGARWWRRNVPIMRRDLSPQDADFAAIFGDMAEAAAKVEPAAVAPLASQESVGVSPEHRLRRTVLGDLRFFDLRLRDESGAFIGILRLNRVSLPEALLARLGRGDARLFERMERVSDPALRPAGILFADLEESGALSRGLSSRAYFELIRTLTDLIDSEVLSRGGIVGKHAGDGGSALFLAAHFEGQEAAAARATIETAVAIRGGTARVASEGAEAKVNIGIHWGATLMVGQVATRGRLEVTALGDQMNEAARLESTARGGQILASKELVERLSDDDAGALGIDLDTVTYTPLSQLDGVGEKALRDAGALAAVAI